MSEVWLCESIVSEVWLCESVVVCVRRGVCESMVMSVRRGRVRRGGGLNIVAYR